MIPCLLLGSPMPPEETALWTTCEEQVRASTFRNERRRREYLTWRTLVRRELGRDLRIAYNDLGAPVLPDGEAFVSVSHCEGRVAVVLSSRPCAVDIEPAGRNFSRVSDRYLTPSEQLLSDDPLWPGFVWCAKEALYKYAGRPGLDFREELRILAADLAAGRIVGQIASDSPVTLAAACTEGFLVVSLL